MNKINVTCTLYVLAALILADLQKIVIAKSSFFTVFKILLSLIQKNLPIFPCEIASISSQKLFVTLTLRYLIHNSIF